MFEERDHENARAVSLQAVEAARKAGADIASVKLHHKSSFAMEVRKGDVENLSQARSCSLSLTVAVDSRRAVVSSSDLSPEAIATLAQRAVGMCRYTDQDPYYDLPKPEWLATEFGDLNLFDPSLLELSLDERIKRVKNVEQLLIKKAPDFSPDGATMSVTAVLSAQANSIGFCRSQMGTSVTQGVSLYAEDKVKEGARNTGRRQSGGWTSRSRHLSDLESAEEIVDTAVLLTRRKLGAQKPKSGQFPVYFEPRMARVLWSHLASAIAGTSVYRRQTYLLDRVKTRVCSPEITILDDPTIPRALGSRRYDAEGVACEPRNLVEAGVLQTYTCGCYSTRKLGLPRPTGHASGVSNLIISAGAYSEEEMLKKMGTGVWLTSVLGQGVNISSGDYSRGALGLWVENGEPQYAIEEFTINSNLDDMLQNIVMVGSNVDENSSIQTPGLVIGDMSLSGS